MNRTHRGPVAPGADFLASRLYRILFIALLLATLGWLDEGAVSPDARDTSTGGERHDR